MNSEILENLDNAYDLLVEQYKELGVELGKALYAGNQTLCKSLEAKRATLKTMFWAIDEFRFEVAPDTYLEP